MTGRLDGRIALVIGAARGIGKTIAQRFAEEGARLVIGDIEAETGEATAAELGAAFIRTDITRLADAEAAVGHALERHGRLDILVQTQASTPGNCSRTPAPTTGIASWA